MALEVGGIVEGKISSITNFGAFVELEDAKVGLVHISEVSNMFVKDIREHVQENQTVKVKILDIKSTGKIELSIKQAQDGSRVRSRVGLRRKFFDNKRTESTVNNFEHLLSEFSKSSAERLGSAFSESNQRNRRNRGFNKSNKNDN